MPNSFIVFERARNIQFQPGLAGNVQLGFKLAKALYSDWIVGGQSFVLFVGYVVGGAGESVHCGYMFAQLLGDHFCHGKIFVMRVGKVRAF